MGSFDIEHILHQSHRGTSAPSPSLQLLQSAVADFKPRNLSYYTAAAKPPSAVGAKPHLGMGAKPHLGAKPHSMAPGVCLQSGGGLMNPGQQILGGQERKFSSESEGSIGSAEVHDFLGCKRELCHVIVQDPNQYDTVYGLSDAMRGYETKRKTSRSVFAPSQIGIMEDIYHGKKKTYLTADYRKDIAKKTGLSETQVKRWWQNRRQKDKNRVRDSLQTLNHYLPSMMFCERPRNVYQPGLNPMNDSMAQLTTTHLLLQQTPNHRLITRTS